MHKIILGLTITLLFIGCGSDGSTTQEKAKASPTPISIPKATPTPKVTATPIPSSTPVAIKGDRPAQPNIEEKSKIPPSIPNI